jgi:ABC-type multidrug transport system fused ATPase/permease subunit
MNTPSHAILNLALLIDQRPQSTSAIVVGAILPDAPIFALYLWAKFIQQASEQEIWTVLYWQPFWQNLTAAFHSIPLTLLGIAVAHYCRWQYFEVLLVSMLFHDFLDLPVHHDDAHRHFLPFSNYRFISPISYWDPKHYGGVVSAIERLTVLLATIYVLPKIDSWLGKGLAIVVNLIYLTGFLYPFFFRRCRNTAQQVPTATNCKRNS